VGYSGADNGIMGRFPLLKMIQHKLIHSPEAKVAIENSLLMEVLIG
jgi:hypothetical protein